MHDGRRDYGTARSLFEEALALCRRELDPASLDTMTVAGGLGECLSEHFEEYSAAEELLRECLTGHQKVMGPNHPATIEWAGKLRKHEDRAHPRSAAVAPAVGASASAAGAMAPYYCKLSARVGKRWWGICSRGDKSSGSSVTAKSLVKTGKLPAHTPPGTRTLWAYVVDEAAVYGQPGEYLDSLAQVELRADAVFALCGPAGGV